METSPTLAKIAKALATFQGEVPTIKKDSVNPFYKSRYATLENAITTVTPALVKNGLVVTQFPEGKTLVTMILHESGEFIRAAADLNAKEDTPQGQGSAISYLRRYSFLAALGIATEDDDGESASRPTRVSYKAPPRRIPPSDDEADGGVIQIDEPAPGETPTDPKVIRAQKFEIARLLKKNYGYTAMGKKPTVTEDRVFDITGMMLKEENYEAIIKELHDEKAE